MNRHHIKKIGPSPKHVTRYKRIGKKPRRRLCAGICAAAMVGSALVYSGPTQAFWGLDRFTALFAEAAVREYEEITDKKVRFSEISSDILLGLLGAHLIEA